MAVNHFEKLYMETLAGPDRPQVAVSFPWLSREELEMVHASVTDEDVKQAMFDIGAFKAPSPEGFQACFFQKRWDVVGPEVTNMVKQAFSTGLVPLDINETFITLIRKVNVPKYITQLRPINLCNVVHKSDLENHSQEAENGFAQVSILESE